MNYVGYRDTLDPVQCVLDTRPASDGLDGDVGRGVQHTLPTMSPAALLA